MARALRILVPGGWYHVTSRANRRDPLYHDDTDRRCFLELVAELPERFGLEVHAFVLMDNHYHLLVRTPQPNLSHALRWLHVTYSMRFNWAHRQFGHVFQGRFKAILIEELRGVVEVTRYLHLNPVRVGRLGLGKTRQQRQARVARGVNPGAELVRQQLAELKSYPWSSWRVYQGAEPAPEWLDTAVIGSGCGGRSREERRKALREYTEAPVRQGRLESPWTGLLGGMVLGSREFLRRVLKGQRSDEAEQLLAGAERWEWPEIVRAAEQLLGKSWPQMVEAWGDWGRDGTMYVAVRYGRHRLVEVVRAAGGVKYQAAAQALRRFADGLTHDPAKARFVQRMKRQLIRAA